MRGDSCHPQGLGCPRGSEPPAQALPPHRRAWLVPRARDIQRVAGRCSAAMCPGCQAAVGAQLHPWGWQDEGICSTAGPSWSPPGKACAPAWPG